LLAYPLLAEPLFSIRTQSLGWMAGYGVLVVLVGLTSLSRRGLGGIPEATSAEPRPPGLRTILLWLALSAVPSGLMLSTTTYLTTDIFAMPLLWVIPLGLYLLSFSIAFAARRGLAAALTAASPVVVLAAGGIAMFTSAETNLAAAAASIVLLFVAAVALHTRLYSLRPEPARLTQFYLVMSAGGALGGLFTALFAPLLFDWTWEHPLLIVAAAALLPLGAWRALLGRLLPPGRPLRMGFAILLFAAFMGALWLQHYAKPDNAPGMAEIAVFAMAVAAGALLAARRWAFVAVCAFLLAALGGITQWQVTLSGGRSRSYFGIYIVRTTPTGERVLLHGKTIHGVQRLDPDRATEPTSYYGRRGGAGQVMLAAEPLYGPHARIGVVGLGVGTLACYRRPGQTWTFFEIDPAVLAYSRRHLFTYLDRCAKGVPVVIGDARLRLASTVPGSFDILAIDAFSSDAIPLHLLTKEAHDIYFRALAPDGILLVHISNHYVELESVLSALAREEHLAAAVRFDRPAGGWPLGESKWVAMSGDRAKLAALTRGGAWRDLRPPIKSVWTDDYASILPQLTWSTFL
jgi:SAM-dependent methyltransferase